METTEKKPKNGFDRLKVKYAKLKAEKETLEAKITELEGKAKAKLAKAEADAAELKRIRGLYESEQETTHKQTTKIKNLSNDLSNAQAAAENYRIKYETAIAHVPFWRKWFNEL